MEFEPVENMNSVMDEQMQQEPIEEQPGPSGTTVVLERKC